MLGKIKTADHSELSFHFSIGGVQVWEGLNPKGMKVLLLRCSRFQIAWPQVFLALRDFDLRAKLVKEHRGKTLIELGIENTSDETASQVAARLSLLKSRGFPREEFHFGRGWFPVEAPVVRRTFSFLSKRRLSFVLAGGATLIALLAVSYTWIGAHESGPIPTEVSRIHAGENSSASTARPAVPPKTSEYFEILSSETIPANNGAFDSGSALLPLTKRNLSLKIGKPVALGGLLQLPFTVAGESSQRFAIFALQGNFWKLLELK